MPNRKCVFSEDKLAALRSKGPAGSWDSLDERRCCVLCEKSFSGRQVFFAISRSGRIRPHCPTEGCAGTPNEWVHTGDPLVSERAWQDWAQLLYTSGEPQLARQISAKTGAAR